MQVSAEGSADEGEPKLRGSRHASPESFTVDTRVARHSCAGEAMPHPGWRRPCALCTAVLRARDRSRTCDLLFTSCKKRVSASVGPYQKVPLKWGFANTTVSPSACGYRPSFCPYVRRSVRSLAHRAVWQQPPELASLRACPRAGSRRWQPSRWSVKLSSVGRDHRIRKAVPPDHGGGYLDRCVCDPLEFA